MAGGTEGLGGVGVGVGDIFGIGGVAGAIGNVWASYNNANAIADATAATNAANAGQAQSNRDFQQMMANSAHQREVADLKAAGLNPILSANGGAATPSGSMATMNPVVRNAVASAIGTAGSLSRDLQSWKKDQDVKDAGIEATKAQAQNYKASAKATEAVMPQLKAEAETRAKKAEFDKGMVSVDGWSQRILQWMSGAASAAGIAARMGVGKPSSGPTPTPAQREAARNLP